jgi:medium-chain acyl-[acyl-carrier-protein] hydrolase
MQVLVPSTSWIAHRYPQAKAYLRLFCFPFAGGNAQSFQAWHSDLPPSIEVCPIELPGHGTRLREPLYRELDVLVNSMVTALIPYLDLPFAFFGHSMGALLAFELTRLLRRQYGLVPTHLFVSGRHAPQILPNPNTTPTYALPHEQFIEKLEILSGTPKTILQNPEIMGVLLPVLRADLTMAETYNYQHEAPLECPIIALGGLQDPVSSQAELEAWQVQTNLQFRHYMLPGNHFFIQSEKSAVLRIIARAMTT